MSESIEIVNNRAIGTTHDGVGKRHSDFSSTERMAEWSGNDDWVNGYRALNNDSVEKTKTTELWKTMGVASEEVFNELYTSVANLSDNISNLDLCTVSTLKDKAKQYGIDAGVMKIWENFPVEIAKMVDLFSINKAHLRGIVEEWSTNGTRKYGLTTISSKDLWAKLVAECEDDETYRKFIRNTFYNTLVSFVNMTPASGGDTPIWNLNGAYNRRFSTNLFSSRVEYANPVEASFGSGGDGGSSDADKLIYERKQQLGIPRYFSEKYYADEILIGDRSLNSFTDAEQEIIGMEIDRRKSLWLNSGVDQYTYVREAKVLHYVRFVTLFANAIYDVTDYDIDKRKSELLDLDETKYLIRTEGGECSVDYSMIESVADILTDYCINVSYFRETIRVQAQKNMLKGTKALLVDSIREILAKNVYSTYGGCENFWRQTNSDGVIGTGIEIPKDLDIDIIEYIDNTRYTNIYAREDDDKDVVNNRFWQISGVQGDLTNEDILDFYNRLTDYRDPWHIFQCANSTESQKDPTYNLYQHLNYVFNSGAFSADLIHKVFDTDLVASRLYPKMPEIYGYDEIVALLRGSSTSAEVPNRLPKVFFDYETAAETLVEAFEEIDCGTPDDPSDPSEEYLALYNRYHDVDTIKTLISSFSTPDEFISKASVLFPCAYFDTIKSREYLYGKIVYEDWETSSIESKIITDTSEKIVTSLCSTTRTIWTSSAQQQIKVENGYTTIVTLSGSDVSTLPEKPYIAEPGKDNSFDTAWNKVLANKYLQNPERMPEVFYYVSEYPSLYDEVFGDYSNYRHDDSISVINSLGDEFNYDAYNALYAEETYKDSMIHESGTFGDALYDYIGDVTYGRRPYSNSQNTVHPSVQVHAFVTALIEYVNSYHAIVRYLDISQPKFETYCQTVVDRVDKIGNTIHYWKNSVDDFSGYTTDYEKNGNDADSNVSQDGPFNMAALQSLLDDKALFIDTIKRETNEYYISDVNGTFILTDSEKQSEIDNITIYYDDICRLATKEIAKFGRDKYGNTYVLYKDSGNRTNRDALGRLWIRKADRPLAFPGIVVDELNGKLSNASQVSLTDNSELEKKIIEQYKYPQRYYDDINTVGCYLTDIIDVTSGNTRCYKVDWDVFKTELAKLTKRESTYTPDYVINHIRDTNGYTALSSFYTEGHDSIVQKYFTFDDNGAFVPSGKENVIWDAGAATPGYCTSTESKIRNYTDVVSIGDYKHGDIVLEMDNYETVNYDADDTFNYHFKSGSDDVKEITFVVCTDSANVSGYSNNFFLDSTIAGHEGTHHSITYHELTIKGIYTIRLPRGDSDTTNQRGAQIAMETNRNTFTLEPIIDDDDTTASHPRTMVGTMVISGDDTNEIYVDFHGDAPTKDSSTVGLASIDGNGQNIGKYFDFTLNETLDVIVLDAKDPHHEGYDKSWAIDAMINRPNNTDGSIEIQFFKDSQHNVEYVHMDDIVKSDGSRRYVGIHCGNVNAGNRVHAVFAKIEENLVEVDGVDTYVPSKNVSFSCNTFGYDRYVENSFVPPVSYAPYRVDGRYHFRVNSDDSKVYVAFCSNLPDHNDRVGNYVSGYDGMVAGSTTFNRCTSLGYLNGVTVVGFDVTSNGLADNGDVRYVLKNETIGYYPQYSGLIGRNMTYANSSMVGRDVFGFELMFDKITGGEESIDVQSASVMEGQEIRVNSANRYDGGFFLEYDKYTSKTAKTSKTAFLYNDDTLEEVDIKDSAFYSMGYETEDDDGVPVKTGAFALGFKSRIVAVAPTQVHSEYETNRPYYYDTDGEQILDVILEDLDVDDDGNATIDSIAYDISEVSNIDQNGNFLIVCRGNHVLSCQYSDDDDAIYVKSVTHFVMDDTLDQIENTFDGKFVAYPSKLNSGKINFIYALTNPSGYLSVGYYVTEYADTATIKDVDIFNGSVFIIFNGTNIDHVFRVGKCFDVGEKTVEEFIVLDESGDGYSTFTSDNDHLFLMPSTLGGTVLIYNPQTDQFDDAYELGRLVPTFSSYSEIISSRVANEKLRMLVHETDDPETTDVDESMHYKEFYINIGSDCNYAILELDKDFPILITYDVKDPTTYTDPTHPGITADDNIELRFKCMFNTTDTGRVNHTLYSWERKTIDISYAKSTASGKEYDAEERYGTPENEYIYGDSRIYRITATGQRKFKIERLYRTGFWPTGEFDEDAYLSFTYNLAGYPNERRNKKFRHWNPDTTFKYTVSGPFSQMGIELGTQHEVAETAEEIEEKFKGMAISRDFDTYWLSGEMLHLVSVPEPSSYEQRKIDCLVDSNLAFAANTIISSVASLFESHANLVCANRTLTFSRSDNSAHINNAERMFNGDESLLLKEVDIVDCNVLNTMRMFEGCTIAPLIGAGFPDSLTSVERMFADCRTANFNWSMTMPGTVISSLSSVFWNCQNGTFEYFSFDPFPRFRKVGDEEHDDEIITIADVAVDITGTEYIKSKSDNERNLNDDWTEVKWTSSVESEHNDESGRFVGEIIDTNDESGRFMSDTDKMSDLIDQRFFSYEGILTGSDSKTLNFANDIQDGGPEISDDDWWEEKFLSFDWTQFYYDRPILNFDDQVIVWTSSIVSPPHYDPFDPWEGEERIYEHSGRFGEVVENSIIGDFMFWNTPKFAANYIGFVNVAHTLCSTVSMFESCGKPYPEVGDEEDGRFMDDSDVQSKIFQERFFSFDMDGVTDAPLLNFSNANNDLYPGLDTFNDTIQMPNLVTGIRMFRGSAFNFKNSTLVTGRPIKRLRETFRRCEYITERGPRIQTYSFRGVMDVSDGQFSVVYIPDDMRAMYAECNKMPTIDVEILGNVVDISQGVTTYPDKMFLCDFMFFGCSLLTTLVGQLNPYATTARGMFASCKSLTLESALEFLATPLIGHCDVKGMFWNCPNILGTVASTRTAIMNALGTNAYNDPFEKPDELTTEGELPWGIYDDVKDE